MNGSTTLTGVGGVLDLSSAVGELVHTGGLLLTMGSNTMRLQDLIIDTTNTSAPVISGLVIVNNVTVSRFPIFTLAAPPGFTVPLPSTAGTVQLSGINIAISPAMASQLNSFIGANVVPASGVSAGTETQYSVFSTYAGS